MEDRPKAKVLSKLYVFADMAKILSLKNASIDSIRGTSKAEGAFLTEIISYVYRNTVKSSLIRGFIVDSLDGSASRMLSSELQAIFQLRCALRPWRL